MKKARLILLLANLALIASVLGRGHRGTWSDGL
jgi:hypothetical protein